MPLSCAHRARAVSALLVVTLLSVPGSVHSREEIEAESPTEEVIDLRPEDRIGWSPRQAVAPLASVFRGGTSFWYEPRRIRVTTTPPGGMVDLFYIRSNFQKRFEQAETPVTVILPKRIEAGPRDAVRIRAFREGYRQKAMTVKMSGKEKEVVLDLEPLPNTLEALKHRYFAGRSSVSFMTKELLEFRVQESADGLTVILNETARSADASAAMEAVQSPMLDEVFGQQLGEDLLVQLILSDKAREKGTDERSRQDYDAARDLYRFTVDLVPADGGSEVVQAAIAALSRIKSSDVSGCTLRFDETLHERLDAGALNRALAPSGDFTDRYLRAAMRRLGEVTPGGVVSFTDGSKYSPTVPIELEAALSQAGGARGYLALLRRFVAELEPEPYRRETLRSLIAPELDGAVFDDVVGAASNAELECVASAS